MPNNVQDTLRELLISTIEGAGKNVGNGDEQAPSPGKGGSGHKGLAAGVGMAALAPVAMKGLSKLAQQAGMDGVQDLVKSPGKAVEGLGSTVGGQVGSSLGDKVSDKVDDAGGPGGILADTVKNALPFGGGGGGGTKGGGLGVGKGRRMPIQQSIDIGLPIETVYNQWTQFEDWPSFMHRVVRASQDEDEKVTFEVKIWTRKREFTADIETQRPNDRIKWKVSSGMTHAGVVTFHELSPHLTRVLLSIDVQPSGLIEKFARGARHVKRATRSDLHRFKAFIEMAEQETGAWRGVIEDGEVVEEHDPSYDEDREYSDPEDVIEELDAQDEESDDEQEEDDDSTADAAGETDEEEEDEEEQARPRARSRRRQSSNGHGSDDEASSPRSGSRSSSRGSSSGSSGRSGSRRGGSSGNGSQASSEGAGSGSRTAGSRGSASKSSGAKSSSAKSSSAKSSSAKSSGTKSSGSSRGSASGSRSSGGSPSSRRSRSRSGKN